MKQVVHQIGLLYYLEIFFLANVLMIAKEQIGGQTVFLGTVQLLAQVPIIFKIIRPLVIGVYKFVRNLCILVTFLLENALIIAMEVNLEIWHLEP